VHNAHLHVANVIHISFDRKIFLAAPPCAHVRTQCVLRDIVRMSMKIDTAQHKKLTFTHKRACAVFVLGYWV
jgi:hypothetical protein